MHLKIVLISLIFVILNTPGLLLAEEQNTIQELNEFWAEVSRTVAQGDFAAYAATYHEDAVLVTESEGTSYPIAQALSRWKQGFLDTQAGNTRASVEFRFVQRLTSATTAHETGIFRYSSVDQTGQAQAAFMHFEALLVKKDGWQMMMEYQQTPATEEEWQAAAGQSSAGVAPDA